VLLPAWLALAAIAAWPWGEVRLQAGAIAASLTVVDFAALSLLPQLGRSFGPVTPPLLAMSILRSVVLLAAGIVSNSGGALLAAGAVALAGSAMLVYATWIEPFRLHVTHEELRSDRLGSGEPLVLLHLTDLHVERITPRERALEALVAELAPDLIVLTGDYLNLSFVTEERAQHEARETLSAICEAGACPVYAVTGSPPVDLVGIVPEVFAGLPITWLADESEIVEIGSHRLVIAGLRCQKERELDAPRLRRLMDQTPKDLFRLLLYHSPDLMPEAADLGVDLYLCGHTHGGQIRLPVFGAILTSSHFWKRYEAGRYSLHDTTLYVSRGIGLEGMGAPRARLFSPPEVVLWRLSG
jgi:predicted MPP superfamily phosphohydrolase